MAFAIENRQTAITSRLRTKQPLPRLLNTSRPRQHYMLRRCLRLRTIALPRGRLMITAPRAPDVPRAIMALRLLCTTLALGRRVSTTAPRARDGCLTIMALRVRPTIAAPRMPRVRLTIAAPRAPRVRPSAAWRVRLTIAVLRRPCMLAVREVGVTAASPRAPLTAAVRWTAAFASGDAMVTTPKNAVMPNAASTGTDKRMSSPCYLVQGSVRTRRPCLACRRGGSVQARFFALSRVSF
jgi:hypothetical protein